MPKSVFTGAYAVIPEVLVAARKAAGLTQTDVATHLGKDQSFVSLIERSQRRIDVLEFVAFARAIGADPLTLLAAILERLPTKIEV
jgi:transcriptional regulator with XRE-family HTH domain